MGHKCYTCSTADSAVTCNARPSQTRLDRRTEGQADDSSPVSREKRMQRGKWEGWMKEKRELHSALIIHTHSLIIVIPCCLVTGGDLIKSISRLINDKLSCNYFRELISRTQRCAKINFANLMIDGAGGSFLSFHTDRRR